MITKFPYPSKNYVDCEIFATIAKFSQSLRKFRYAIAKIPASVFAFCILQPAFHHFQLDISSNPYELSINQHNCDAKLDMMEEVHETCKTTKNDLETKLVVLMDLHMSIGLNNMISTQKALKTYLK